LQILVRLGKCVDFEAKNSEDFKLSVDMENVKTSAKIQKISNSRPTRTQSSRLQVWFSPINFWSLLTWNASIFMDEILAKFAKFFGVQLGERRKGFLYLSKF
jgi:hypothetical protein